MHIVAIDVRISSIWAFIVPFYCLSYITLHLLFRFLYTFDFININTFCIISVRCNYLSSPASGAVAFTNGNNIGSIANYSCEYGYSLVGDSATRVCLANGTWDCSERCCEIYQTTPAAESGLFMKKGVEDIKSQTRNLSSNWKVLEEGIRTILGIIQALQLFLLIIF